MPQDYDIRVRLNTRRPIEVVHSGHEDTVVIETAGKRFRFTQNVREVLTVLQDFEAHSISELSEKSSGKLDPRAVKDFITELMRLGLIALEKKSTKVDLC